MTFTSAMLPVLPLLVILVGSLRVRRAIAPTCAYVANNVAPDAPNSGVSGWKER